MSLFEAVEKRFDEQFKCIQSDCAGGGHTRETEEEPEGGQCQFCAEYIYPIKSFFRTEFKTLLEELEKSVDEDLVMKMQRLNYDMSLETCYIKDPFYAGMWAQMREQRKVFSQKIKEFISKL